MDICAYSSRRSQAFYCSCIICMGLKLCVNNSVEFPLCIRILRLLCDVACGTTCGHHLRYMLSKRSLSAQPLGRDIYNICFCCVLEYMKEYRSKKLKEDLNWTPYDKKSYLEPGHIQPII